MNPDRIHDCCDDRKCAACQERARQRRQITVRLKPHVAKRIRAAASGVALRDGNLATVIEYLVGIGRLDDVWARRKNDERKIPP